jgi:hypothetical protein
MNLASPLPPLLPGHIRLLAL